MRARLQRSAAVTEALASQASSIERAAALIAESFRSGGKLLLCGNGGSAADCQHMAAEFVGRLRIEVKRPALPAIALTTDTSFLTAHANDVAFDDVFARQVQGLGAKGDVLIGISTSGKSRNVIAAAEEARRRQISVVALAGEGGPLADAADVAIRVPAHETQMIQQGHLAVEHIICELVEQMLYCA